MAACCPSSSSSDSGDCSREEVLQHRLDQMRRERQSELKSIGNLVADTADSRAANLRRLLDPQQPQTSAVAAAAADHDGQQQQQRTDAATGTTASSSATILVEVRGLSELRPVSRILQSSAFRTELESLVRYSLSPRPSRPQQTPQQQQVEASRAAASSPPASSSSAAAPQPAVAPVQPAFEAQTFTELRRQRHDDLVQEINELLHSQLVSGGWDGAFRSRLDQELRARADALPDGGRRAEAAVRSLPPSAILRNDFSHLGIFRGEADANSSAASVDDILSVVSLPIVTAEAGAGASNVAAGAAVSRQLHSVQREMCELRRTVRLLLGNQLETQRMIRQEVAAALAGRSVPALPVHPPPPHSAAGDCLICLSARADTVMYRCGHLCLCSLCTARMRDSAQDRMACPVCRAPVVDTLRVFSAGLADN